MISGAASSLKRSPGVDPNAQNPKVALVPLTPIMVLSAFSQVSLSTWLHQQGQIRLINCTHKPKKFSPQLPDPLI